MGCPKMWEDWLPPGVCRLEREEALYEQSWDLLALTAEGCRRLGRGSVRCGTLLVPGDCPLELLAEITAEQVISYGLSPRDSLTLSSLSEPVLCVQRTLLRPDGETIEPQEFPLPPLPAPPAELLPVLGLRLLQISLTGQAFFW